MGGEIWALCESKNGRVPERSLEVVGAALYLAGLKHGVKCASVVFSDVEAAHRCGMGRAYVLHGATGEADSRGRLLAEAIEEYKPDIVLASAALEGRGVCSVAAAILGTGMSADCIDLAIGNAGELISTRPALGSSVIAGIVCPVKRPQITTIRPGSFEPVRVTEVETEVVEFSGTRTFVGAEVIGRREINKDGPDLARSRIIIAGGMGLASAAAFDRIRELARVLHAGVAASRAAVNAGYATYDMQVGLSGKSVRPDVYIALGISGAAQHIVGIRQAKKVIAVNTDSKAPIFNYADVGIVAGWEEYTGELMKLVQEGTRKG